MAGWKWVNRCGGQSACAGERTCWLVRSVENATGGGPLQETKGGAHLFPIKFLDDQKIE